MTSYHLDDSRRRIVIEAHGQFGSADAREVLARAQSDGVWSYAWLYDFTHATLDLVSVEIDGLMQLATRQAEALAPRGPVAVVAPDREAYWKACRYAVLSRRVFRVQVFHTRIEAEAWLNGV